jgi:hypothetical protein
MVHHALHGKDHDSRWLSRKNLTFNILQMKVVPNLAYGRVYSLESHGGMKVVTYELTVGVIPNCTCPNFVSMFTSLKKKGKFIPCKHLHFIYKTRMFCDYKTNDFINQPTLSINKVKKLS